MKMKFNFDGPLTLKGKSCSKELYTNIEIHEDNISEEIIFDVAKKLYSAFDVDLVSLYIDDVWICYIEQKEEEENK